MKWNMRLVFAVSLLALFGTIARADTVVGTGSAGFISGSIGQPTSITADWCKGSLGFPPTFGCPTALSISGTIGPILPSNSPQSFDISAADDANFAAIAATITSGFSSCEFDAAFGGGSFDPCAFGPATSVDLVQLTISPFQFVFDSTTNDWEVVGTSGPPLNTCPTLDPSVPCGFPAYALTVEAFGTPTPEPTSISLIIVGLVGLTALIRRLA